jgi:DNA-binding response OmpR family regulator
MRALIIEDEKTMAEFIKLGLENIGYAVDLARDGEDGSFLARTNNYEVIILDLILPGINGQQVIKEIREDKKNTIIITISVDNQIDNRLSALNAGADDYLAKPLNIKELIARIRANVKRKDKPIIAKNINFHDLNMNLNTFEVHRKNKKLSLTKREFSLLKFFLLNTEKVLSRTDIMESVWDINGDPLSNTIETHIMRLRKKTEKHGKRLIHTVNGYGYKLNKNN